METKFYKPKYFGTVELVPPAVWSYFKSDSALIVMDSRILITADQIRDFLGIPLIINNWFTGGNRFQCGYRNVIDEKTPYSQHYAGRALDVISHQMSAQEMRLKIIENNRLFPFLTRIEDKVDWLHIDCANMDTSPNSIAVFKAT
jgi:hypothetical protein